MKKKTGGRKPKPIVTIAIDGGSLSREPKHFKGGVYTVTYNLISELAQLDKKNNYILYSFAPIEKGLISKFKGRAKNKVLSPAIGYKTIRLPLALFLDKPDVFLATSQAVPAFAPKTVGFIYDLAFMKYPDLYHNVAKLKTNTDQLIVKSNHIVTISEASKTDIETAYKVDDSKISILYPGVANYYSPKGIKYVSTKHYFLFVGHLKKTKNIPFLIEAFAEFMKNSANKYQLVLVGSSAQEDPGIDQAIKKFQLGKMVIKKGYVATSELPKYYRGALALVNTSLYEGFGLPLVEAMACGCPVISTKTSAIPEVVGSGGIILPKNTMPELVSAMTKVAGNEMLRGKLRKQAIKQAKQFNWHHFARGVLHAINLGNEFGCT